jgi:hypothetical protein
MKKSYLITKHIKGKGKGKGKGKVKLLLCFNWASRQEDVLGEWRYSSTHSLTSALVGGEWSVSRPGCFTPRERTPGTHWIGGWVCPRAVLDAMVKRKIPSPCWESNPRTLIVQLVAQCHTDWDITALQQSMCLLHHNKKRAMCFPFLLLYTVKTIGCSPQMVMLWSVPGLCYVYTLYISI